MISGAGEGASSLVTLMGGGLSLGMILLVALGAFNKTPRQPESKGTKRMVFWCDHCRRWHGTRVWFEPQD